MSLALALNAGLLVGAPLLAEGVTGVNLPAGMSGSALLRDLMVEMVCDPAFGETFGDLAIPPPGKAFKRGYPRQVTAFEARRVASDQRLAIAARMTARSLEQMVYVNGAGRATPLLEYLMRGEAEPLAVTTQRFSSESRLAPRVPYRGKTYVGGEIADLARLLLTQGSMTAAAAEALAWVRAQEVIDLSAQKFVVLGAGAELAPTPLLFLGNAQVLWIDVKPPSREYLEANGRGGTVVYPKEGADLLRQPREIAATIREFAGGDPVHVGTFAYVGGEAREWRLTAAMNAIIRSLEPGMVASVSFFISPTSPMVPQAEDVGRARAALEDRAGWQAFLQLAGYLRTNHFAFAGHHLVQAMVRRQGATYLAAQWIEKIMTAEVFALLGVGGDWGLRSPTTVSSNVAGISRTRSMDTPVFQAGFLGAEKLGLETYPPLTTRWLSGLLLLHDLLNPDAAGQAQREFPTEREKIEALFAQQVHGGVYAYPYALEQVIALAALLGFAGEPRLLRRLFG